ncbi:sensor histidine kinase [Konateibacter massiliensis]|uniref:sensor histidine kinase n=1 Tax=Konateibacter massiliensis TaxID=2002841 RepID=UPI0015D48107|nr:sensor histidine kinase [Konateibacter massiliensis]
MKGIRKFFGRFKIKTKIILLYLTVLLLSFLMTFTIISKVNEAYTKREVGNAGIQTVNALKGNLTLVFENVTQFSNLIYFDDNVQDSLKNVKSKNIDPTIQRRITKSLVNMLLSGDYISSVFIFDKYNNYYNTYKVGPISVHSEKIESTDWYAQMQEANGNGFFIHKSEDILEFPTRKDKNYITYIKEIGAVNTYEPLATLLVTVDETTIQSYFEEVSSVYDSHFFIVDGEGNYIIPPSQYEEEYAEYIDTHKTSKAGYEMVDIKDSTVIMVSQEMGISDWKLVGSFQMDNLKALTPYYTTVIILIMCLNILFVFICSMALTRFIFTPLAKLEKHMKMVEEGEFIPIRIDGEQNEINNLKKVFNHMTKSIQNLIEKVKVEEKIIAKGELDLIQAQINPHFLYNTLDAVSALALMKDNESCFKMTQALGSFYRNSLNSGLDFVTIQDEIQCIRSYITILNIRYDDKIKVEYDVEEHLLNCKILKLLLQPLIENAVHHGIKGNDGAGHILVKIFEDEEEIILIVLDDGVGMSEERVHSIMEGKSVTGKSGFGIYSLKQRITLYYGIQNPIMIHSEVGGGCEITVRVKKMEEGEAVEH